MGSSMAQLFAGCGYQVALYDISGEAVERSRELIRVNQEAAGGRTDGGRKKRGK